MIDIKKTVGSLPKNVRADTDFSYLSDLSTVHRRVAVFYEYARESEELRKIVSEMKRERIFESEEWDASGELGQRLAELSSVLPPDHLLILYDCRGFPEKPFRDARYDLDIFKHISSFGVESVGRIPWEPLTLLQRTVMRQGWSELEYWTKYWTNDLRRTTLNAICIPWNYTNAEIAESFAKLLRRIRPHNFPEPTKAGRKGRSSSGATDILNQLVAFRLRRAGVPLWRARSFGLVMYSTERGWNNAATAAEERIRHILVRPLFSS
jgi:hypothetical protein